MFWLSRSTLGDFRKSCGELPPSATETRLVQITFPLHFAAQLANCALRMCFQKQPETRFYDRSLGTGAAAAHGLMHQLVIDLDIGSHEGGLSMCVRIPYLCVSGQTANFFFRDDENRILVGKLKDLNQPAESGEKISFTAL